MIAQGFEEDTSSESHNDNVQIIYLDIVVEAGSYRLEDEVF